MDDKIARQLSDFNISANKIVSDEPGWLYSLIVTGSGAGQNYIALYDGQTTTDPQRISVQSIQYDTIPIVLKHPWRFNKGLYIVFAAGSGVVSGQFLKDP